MGLEIKNHTNLKIAAIVATIITGIAFEFIGMHMFYIKTTTTFGDISFPAGLILVVIGLALIVVALGRFSKTNPQQSPVKSWASRNWLILFGIVILGIFIGTHYEFPAADKYRVLVDLILIILAVTAAVGYGIFRWISRSVSGQVMKEAREDRNISRAQTHTSLGYSWFQHYSIGIENESPGMSKIRYLELAIDSTRRAIDYANRLTEKEEEVQEEIICVCKNNLAYYLAERQRDRSAKGMKIDLHDKKEAHELAKYAYQVARSERASRYREPYQWEETYAYVLWRFADDDEESKKKALEIVHELKSRTTLPFEWRQNLDKVYIELMEIKEDVGRE